MVKCRLPLLIICLAVLPCAVHVTARAEMADERFVAGLLERRLFALAELECTRQLSNDALSPRDRTRWTVELVRIQAVLAAHALPQLRAALWQSAHQTATDFGQRYPQNPNRVLVELQDALTYLAEGEMARLEADVAVESQDAVALARDTIREATRRLESVDRAVTEMLALAHGRPGDDQQLSADELFALQNNVRYQLARALRNQALCYAVDSSDRVAALNTAVKQLHATLTQLQATDPLTWQVYLDLARCYRLAGDLPQARRALAVPLAETTPIAPRLDAVAELARVLTAEQHLQQGLDEIARARAAWPGVSAELDFAELEAMLALWRGAAERKDNVLAGQWQKKVAGAVAAIEQTHGAYWGRRAKLGQLSVASDGLAEGDLDILVASAHELYHQQQFDEAIGTYEKAAELARNAGNMSKAIETEYLASLVEQLLNRPEAASRRQRRLALELPSQEIAPAMHFAAIQNLVQAVRHDSSLADRYQAWLEEHAAQWPDAPTTNTVRQWLGDWHRSQAQWENAISAYRAITVDSPPFLQAVDSLAECWESWLDQRRQAGEPLGAILASATDFLDSLILDTKRQWPERWSPVQLQAALITARLRLKYAPQSLSDAQHVLQAALEHAPQDNPAWRDEALGLLVVALAGQAGQQQQALAQLAQLGSSSVDRRLQLLRLLAALAPHTTAEVHRQIAQVQLAAVQQLSTDPTQLTAAQRQDVDQVRAGALRAAGHAQEALALYRRLSQQQPDNGALQMDYGDALLSADDEATLSEAIVQWQKIAQRVPPDTDDWFRARYNIAVARFKRNRPASPSSPSDRAVAAQRLQLLQLTSALEQTRWKDPVAQLLEQCGRAQPDH